VKDQPHRKETQRLPPVPLPSFLPSQPAKMAKSSCLLLVLGGLLSGTLANHGNSPDFSSNCCKFTLSSTGGFDCPAGELLDGQIRLNGTYDSSTFCLDKEGGITNSRGFGCIVTSNDSFLTYLQTEKWH